MSRFNTGNPLDSDALKDLSDNAKNADLFSNDVNNESYKDRFGRNRKTIRGMELEFDRDQKDRDDRFKEFILSSGYQFVGDYAAGVKLTEYNQLVRDENGEFWRVSGQVDLPYVTTGAGIPEDGAFVSVGDATLRQELANPDKGAAMVARGVVAVDSIAALLALPEEQRREDLRYLVKGSVILWDGSEFQPETHVSIDAFGGDPSGTVSSSAALVSAVEFVSKVGGGEIVGQTGGTYRFNEHVTISESNITINMQGATLIGNGRITFNGDSGIDGDRSAALTNVHFKNAVIGREGVNDSSIAPRFFWCNDSSMTNIRSNSVGYTLFDMHYCQASHFRDISMKGSKSSAIGALMLHSEDCTFENIVITGGSLWVGFQVKGGRDNLVKNCKLLGVAGMDYGFYDRGDAPGTTSPTPGTYPYTTLGWNVADSRRASVNTTYEDCIIRDSNVSFVAFQSQENDSCTFVRCKTIGGTVTSGFSSNRTQNNPFGNNVTFSECVAEYTNGVVFSVKSTGAPLEGVRVQNCVAKGGRYQGFEYINAFVDSFNNKAIDCLQDRTAVRRAGFDFSNSVVKSLNDTSESPLQVYGFEVDAECILDIAGSTVKGFTTRPYHILCPVSLVDSRTPVVYNTSIDNGSVQAHEFKIPADSEYIVEYECYGTVSGEADNTFFKRAYKLTAPDGVLEYSALVDFSVSYNPLSVGSPFMQIVSGTCRFMLRGLAGQTVTWRGHVKFMRLS